jgi:hypothetical protein
VPTRLLNGFLGLPNSRSKSFNRDNQAASSLLNGSQSAVDDNGLVLRHVGFSHR